MTTREDEIRLEQKYLDEVLAVREELRESLGRQPSAAVNQKAQRHLYLERQRRRESLQPPDAAVAIGRTDAEDETTRYIGRDAILRNQVPLVVSWRSPEAIPYYQASFEDPLGVWRKRTFESDHTRLIGFSDVVFGEDPAAEPTLDDPLLRELETARTGRLGDIVATIQRHQDQIMRAPMDSVMIVEGGPGTGKTVVGLHRAALLLFANRDTMTGEDLLVIGPSTLYLRYVEDVLPRLGERHVPQVTATGLVPEGLRPTTEDDAALTRLKGDPRMAEVLQRAIGNRQEIEGFSIELPTQTVTLQSDEAQAAVAQALSGRSMPHNSARRIVRNALADAVASKSRHTTEDVLRTRDFMNVLQRSWPALSPQQFLQALLSSGRQLREASDGILTDDERYRLARTAGTLTDQQWSEADMPLLDEAEALLNDGAPTYRHLIVDEVQNLTPMQLRAIGRRIERSATLLGDLAQAAGDWPYSTWDQVLDHLGLDPSVEVRRETLRIGYRVPKEVLEFAEQVLEHAGIGVEMPEAVRSTGTSPEVHAVAAGTGPLKAAAVAQRLLGSDVGTVGLIAPREALEDIGRQLDDLGVAWRDAGQDVGDGLNLVSAREAKGLEFDIAVVYDPTAIRAYGRGGDRLLYSVLTRPTKRLAVVYERPPTDPISREAADAFVRRQRSDLPA